MDNIRKADESYNDKLINNNFNDDNDSDEELELLRNIHNETELERAIRISAMEYEEISKERIQKFNHSEELEKINRDKIIEKIKKEKENQLKNIMNKLLRIKTLEKNDENESSKIYNLILIHINNDEEIMNINENDYILMNNFLIEKYEKPLKLNKRCFINKTEYEYLRNRFIMY
jgi:esterase/lipase